MDVFVTRGVNRFVWDSDKAAANLSKHGVSFDRAIEVFVDPFHELLNAGVSSENRIAAVGFDLSRRLLFVVYLETEREQTRIVSARRATGIERRDHENPK